jgi:hypothetical protein
MTIPGFGVVQRRRGIARRRGAFPMECGEHRRFGYLFQTIHDVPNLNFAWRQDLTGPFDYAV